jgi:predicted nuclease of predicted toxin-antitoxin system
MKILADENCDRLLVAELRAEGFDVVWIREISPGIGDPEVFAFAAANGRLLITNDRGFGLRAEARGLQRPAGIVLTRLQRLMPATRTSVAVQIIKMMGNDLLDHFTVVEPHQVRSRPFKNNGDKDALDP